MSANKNPYLQDELKYFLHTFKRQPLLIEKARGAYVWDEAGKKYLDFYSGLAVCGVGHANPAVVRALTTQAGRLIHSSNYFYTRPQFDLAKALTARWKNSRVFFGNSGAEANELAIKLARLWANRNGKAGREIVTFHNAFHGRTLATMAASQGGKRGASVFAPLPDGFVSVPFNDLDAAAAAVNEKTIAFLVEPVQGEGGIHVGTPAFLKGLETLAREKKLLLLMDEIQSGMGRTGAFFAFQRYGIQPDVVSLAKGLAGGLPLGAVLAQPHVADLVVPGLHGSTFGGNPVACAAALEVLKQLAPAALRRIRQNGDYLLKKLAVFRRYSSVKTIRGLGLMIGIELHASGAPYVDAARDRGLLINCTQETVLRFLPPYFMSRAEMDGALKTLESVFNTLNS